MDIQFVSRASWNYFSENVVDNLNSTEKKVIVFALSIFSLLAIGYYFYRFCRFERDVKEVKLPEDDVIEDEKMESPKTEVVEEEKKTETCFKLPGGRTLCIRDNVVEVGNFNKEGKLEGVGQRLFTDEISLDDFHDPDGIEGIRYERGIFNNGVLDSFGEVQFNDRRIYIGDFANGILVTGEKNYLNVRKSNIDIEQGNFVGDELDGLIKFRDGKIQLGKFEKGILKTMRVTLHTLMGKTMTLKVQQKATVADLKKEVEKKEGTPFDQQRIVFHGKQLTDDDKALEDCGMTDGCDFQMVLRLSGD